MKTKLSHLSVLTAVVLALGLSGCKKAAPPALHAPGDAVALGFDPARLWAVEAS